MLKFIGYSAQEMEKENTEEKDCLSHSEKFNYLPLFDLVLRLFLPHIFLSIFAQKN
jgi:hypothetical protein